MSQNTENPQAKASEMARAIKEGKENLKGTDMNPVQVSTEDLKMGKEDAEAKLRAKTEHVGRIASTVTAAAKEESSQTADTQQARASEMAKAIKEGKVEIKGSDQNPVQVATEDLKMGKEDNEAELREKTEHVGRIASTVMAAAKES